MKLYGVKIEKRTFSWGDMDVVALGEKGRGRQETLVTFQANPETLEGNCFEIALTQKGLPKIIKTQETPGYIAVLSGAGCYTRGTYGTVRVVTEDREKVEVLANGYGAYGDAGRIGSWNAFLVKVKPKYPVRFRVQPAGGSRKIDRYWLVFTEQKVFKVRNEEADAFSEATGIEFPDLEKADDVLTDLAALTRR